MHIGSYDLDDAQLEATRQDGEPRVRVYPVPRPMVVLGRGSDPAVELNLLACERDGVEIVRRRGGGCAVYLDPGNLVVAVTRAVEGLGGSSTFFQRITDDLSDALATLGVPGVHLEGISDLAIGEGTAARKVGGACIYRTRGLLYYSTTLLLDPDLEAMTRYLAHPPREPAYRAGRPHTAFVAPLPTPIPTPPIPTLGDANMLKLCGFIKERLVTASMN